MNDADTIRIWLGDLEQALADLPTATRRDIVREARAHLEDGLATGLSASIALRGFGTVKDYARPFIEDYVLSSAYTPRFNLRGLWNLSKRTLKGLSTVLGLTGTATFAGFTFFCMVLMLDKMVSPQQVGFFTAPGYRNYIGRLPSGVVGATEHLGIWFFPLMIGLIAVSVCLSCACLRFSGFTIVPARSKPSKMKSV